MSKRRYSPISVRSEVADTFRALAQGLGMENTEALQVCMAAYDIINSTHGGSFKEAADRAFKEAAQGE